ncbi:methyltransferase family protein [Edaphobacter aggregans]|uniref:methyltransferase family protein n=1 Tax=Edaphobacter aggregans TaxID=570835 RepID=UPI000689B5C8|nr:isoprenylcysteine carboxylmethyltransferase family protein [Edaphobacter aggregans]
MRFSPLFRYANSLWLFFALYFLTQYRPVRVKRNGVISILSVERLCAILGVGLVFFPRLHLSILARPFHTSSAIATAGFVLVVLGLAFAAWARDVLGRNWSGRVIIQDSHQLITSGPYAYVRHPLYTGIIAGIAGMVLLVGDLGALTGFFFALAFTLLKAAREERLLEAEFGPAYAAYRERTGALLPRLAHV